MRPQRTHHTPEPGARPRTAVAPARVPLALTGARAVLALQRSAGNYAVSRALAAAASPPSMATVARVKTTWDKPADTMWVKETGTQFEETAFPERASPAANIAGTYPIIDDFSGGVATSLKTIDIVSRYQGKAGIASLTATVNRYKSELRNFRGRRGLVADDQIKTLRLRIAIPPKPAEGAPGYDERRDALRRAANEPEDPDLLALNIVHRRALRSRASERTYAHGAVGSKRTAVEEPEEVKGPKREPVTMVVEVVERAGIWTDVPGRKYEQKAFPGQEREAANIGGNFPTIDDFRGGVATSLKTINIVERFDRDPVSEITDAAKHNADAVKRTVVAYADELGRFTGARWPAGPNYRGAKELLDPNDNRFILVARRDIRSVVLQIAIPPVDDILAAKQAERDELMEDDEEAEKRLDEQIRRIKAKRAVVLDYDGKSWPTKSGFPMTIKVETRA